MAKTHEPNEEDINMVEDKFQNISQLIDEIEDEEVKSALKSEFDFVFDCIYPSEEENQDEEQRVLANEDTSVIQSHNEENNPPTYLGAADNLPTYLEATTGSHAVPPPPYNYHLNSGIPVSH